MVYYYITLRDCSCDGIALNGQTPTDDKSYDAKGSLYVELEHAFNQFPK
jgi:hypothetical protein